MTKLFKNLLIGLISFFLLISITILGVLWTFSNKIPDYKFLKNYKPAVSSKMYSGNGEVVADFSKEKRIFVKLKLYINFKALKENLLLNSGGSFLDIFRAKLLKLN